MSIKSYFEDNKRSTLPWVTDFHDPQNHIRFEKNVKKLSYKEWFWCHPSAYTLLNLGGEPIAIVCLIGLIILLFIKQWYLPIILPMILIGVYAWILKNKIKTHKLNKNMTFYDLWMREYDEIEVKKVG